MDFKLKIQAQSPQILGAAGNWDNFWGVAQQIYEDKLDWLIKELITSETVVPIAPGNMLFEITNPLCDEVLIDKNKEYQVFDLNYNLLYEVAFHDGKFGFSPLDKLHIINGKDLDLFYLFYTLEDGNTQIKSLFLNKI